MRIVNRRTNKCAAIYCGRTVRALKGSPLGNPFKNAANSIALYRDWLQKKIAARDPAVMAALAEIKEDSTISCWCVDLEGEACFQGPIICHTQIIAAEWRKLQAAKAV